MKDGLLFLLVTIVVVGSLYTASIASKLDSQINSLGYRIEDNEKAREFLIKEHFTTKKEIQYLHNRSESFPR